MKSSKPKAPNLKALKPKTIRFKAPKPCKIPAIEAQMERLGRDLENIELMNDWGLRDALQARRDLEKIAQQSSLSPRLKKQAQMW